MRPLRLLHLEDETFDADLLQRAAQRLDVDTRWHRVADAAAYEQALAEGAYDAIVSDGCLPGFDGMSALRLAREARPAVPFVFVSGHADDARVRDALAAGATDYIPKDQPWRLGPVLQHLQLQRERAVLERRARAMNVLLDAVRELSLARSLDDIVRIVRLAARQMTQADGATFILRDGDQCHYVDEEAIGPLWKGSRFPMSNCISGWAMLNRQPALVPDIYVDPRIPHEAYRPTFVKSLAMVPIRANAPIGAIGNYWSVRRDIDAEDVEMLQALADTTSVALENVGILRDLETRVQQRTAELEAANAGLEAFSYSVSHDLRAPLRAISGYGELLAEQRERLDAEGRLHLDRIRQSAQRMDGTIVALLGLAQVTRAEVRSTRVDLSAMAAELVAAIRERSGAAPPTARIQAGVVVDGDAGLLRVALQNLLDNAAKYSAKAADPQIEFAAEPDAQGRWVCRVGDNGVGFDMAKAGSMFEPFRRFHPESEFSGHGIGLTIVQRAIHKHGGTVWAESTPGLGANFYFALPLATRA